MPRGNTGYGTLHDSFCKVASQFPHPVLVHPLFCSKNFNFVIPKNGKMLVQTFKADGEGSRDKRLYVAFILATVALKHTNFIPFKTNEFSHMVINDQNGR